MSEPEKHDGLAGVGAGEGLEVESTACENSTPDEQKGTSSQTPCASTERVEDAPAKSLPSPESAKPKEHAKVSFFHDIATTTPTMSIPMDGILAGIGSGLWREHVTAYRGMPETDKAEIERKKAAKRAMPSFTPAGVFRLRKKSELELLSGYAVLDFDKVRAVAALKAKLAALPYVTAVFISLGGDGLKVIIRIPAWVLGAEDFELFIHEAMVRTSAAVEAPIDVSGKDVCRACFMSDDPAIHWTTECAPYPGTRDDALLAAPVRTKPATAPGSPPKTPRVQQCSRKTRATRHDIEVALASLPHLGYDEWIKVIAAVHDGACRAVISHEEIVPLLRRYHPEVTEGEYQYQLQHLLDGVHLETLFFLANKYAGTRVLKKEARHV